MFLRSRWLAPALVVGILVFGLAVYGQLPSAVPTHWNLSGEVNGTMPRAVAVVFVPLLALAVWLLLLVLPRIDPRGANYARFQPTFRLILNLTVAFLVAIQLLVLGRALGWGVSAARLLPVAVGLFFAALGNELGRVRPNWFIGIRTPWTLASDEVWRRTHRVGGRAFVAGGLLIAVVALLAPRPVGIAALLIVVLTISLGLTAYSYLLYQRLEG